MPKKAPEVSKPLSFVTPNPWSALPREVYVGKGRGKKEEATTESPVDQPRIYTIRGWWEMAALDRSRPWLLLLRSTDPGS